MMPRFAAVLALLVTCGGCALPLFNRTERIAIVTLGGEWHTFDKDVYSAAIQARFPKGTSFQEFEVFVRRLKGDCHVTEAEPNQHWCEVPVKGGICWAELIGFDVTVEGGGISTIEVHTGGLSC